MNQTENSGRFATSKISGFLITQPILAALAAVASRLEVFSGYLRGDITFLFFCICTALTLSTLIALRIKRLYSRYAARYLVMGLLLLQNVLLVFTWGHLVIGLFLLVPILSQCYQNRALVRGLSILSAILACASPAAAYFLGLDKFLRPASESLYVTVAQIVMEVAVLAILCGAIITAALFTIRITNYQTNLANLISKNERLGVLTREQFQISLKHTLSMNPAVEYDLITTNVMNFRLYNDLFGYEAGDKLLRRIAELLSDYAGDDGLVGRLNDDHLVTLITRDRFDSEYLHKHFFRSNELSNNKNYTVDVVFGVYEIIDSRIASEIMCDRALMAANSETAKKEGVALFREAMLFDAHKSKEILNELLVALVENQFVPYLQVQCDAKGEMVCAEVLARWLHPERGIVLPGEFIPVCEEYGYITELDLDMWSRACETLHRWDEKGYPISYLSVNVSVIDLYQMDVLASLSAICEKYRLAHDRLHLEITESAMMNDREKVVEIIRGLRSAGFVIEIDDFGSGYSSLGMLSELEIDYIKLDVSFVQRLGREPNAEKVLKRVADLARDINTRVIVEGVETAEQLELLASFGYDCFQGFYFSKAVSVQDFEKKYFSGYKAAEKPKSAESEATKAETDASPRTEESKPVRADSHAEAEEPRGEGGSDTPAEEPRTAPKKEPIVHGRKWLKERSKKQVKTRVRRMRR